VKLFELQLLLLALKVRLLLGLLLLEVKAAGLTTHPLDLRDYAHQWVELGRLLWTAAAERSHKSSEREADYKRDSGVSQVAAVD
jgi:hypothetical protein